MARGTAGFPCPELPFPPEIVVLPPVNVLLSAEPVAATAENWKNNTRPSYKMKPMESFIILHLACTPPLHPCSCISPDQPKLSKAIWPQTFLPKLEQGKLLSSYKGECRSAKTIDDETSFAPRKWILLEPGFLKGKWYPFLSCLLLQVEFGC